MLNYVVEYDCLHNASMYAERISMQNLIYSCFRTAGGFRILRCRVPAGYHNVLLVEQIIIQEAPFHQKTLVFSNIFVFFVTNKEAKKNVERRKTRKKLSHFRE